MGGEDSKPVNPRDQQERQAALNKQKEEQHIE